MLKYQAIHRAIRPYDVLTVKTTRSGAVTPKPTPLLRTAPCKVSAVRPDRTAITLVFERK